jgi:hypothetical protein
VLNPARGFCFPTESGLRRLVFDKTLTQNFHGNGPINEQVKCPIDRSHATDTKSFFEAVLVIESLTNQRINR